MADGGRIIEGLQQAVAHAKGEATGAREHVTVSRAELEALRAVAAAAELWRLGRGGQNPTGTLLTRLEAYIRSDAGAWLRALDRAREATK